MPWVLGTAGKTLGHSKSSKEAAPKGREHRGRRIQPEQGAAASGAKSRCEPLSVWAGEQHKQAQVPPCDPRMAPFRLWSLSQDSCP